LEEKWLVPPGNSIKKQRNISISIIFVLNLLTGLDGGVELIPQEWFGKFIAPLQETLSHSMNGSLGRDSPFLFK
jgi:hypothetical protein